MNVPLRVGFQGAPGAFSEQALLAAIDRPVIADGFDSFDAVGRAVAGGVVHLGCLPVENALAGSVTPSYDVLASQALFVVAEVVMPIRHCLLGVRGSRTNDIRRVTSHPMALAQCRRFLRANPAMRVEAVFDTAGAAAEVGAAKDPTTAAIAPLACAERYDLDVLVHGVEDRCDNQTRFLLVTRNPDDRLLNLPRGSADRAMIVAEIPHRPGALARLLTGLAKDGHNLTKIEGCPGEDPRTSRFVLEFEVSDTKDCPTRLGVADLEGSRVRVLGIFPRIHVGGAASLVASP